MHTQRWILFATALLALPALAGCLSDDKDSAKDPELPPEPPQDTFRPRVVVAVIDTGMQPYHHEFRALVEDPTAHPSTYVPGYPADTPALAISLNDSLGGEDDNIQGFWEADADLWPTTKQGQLYWYPGTKIIGSIAFGKDLPGSGHGSMTSSRAAGNTISIGGPEILLVHVTVPLVFGDLTTPDGDSPEAQAVRWAADQPWIDIQTNSWGMPFMCVGPPMDMMTGWMRSITYAAENQITFAAVHNGHRGAGLLGYPSQCQDTAGPAGVYRIGAMDNDALTLWSNWYPEMAADGACNPAIDEQSTTRIQNTGGGTSSATPFSAGGAAKILLEARRILQDPAVGMRDGGILAEAAEGAILPENGPLADGVFTRDELRTLMHHTALVMPTVDPSDGDVCGLHNVVPISSIPEEARYQHLGYGEINHASIDHAVAVIRGEAEPHARPTEDALFAADQSLRTILYG